MVCQYYFVKSPDVRESLKVYNEITHQNSVSINVTFFTKIRKGGGEGREFEHVHYSAIEYYKGKHTRNDFIDVDKA